MKGFLDESGAAQEKIFDVHVADSLVDGEAQISVVWEDPDFDPAAPAFYYVRVLEVPTPRWTAIDAARYGKPIAGMRVKHQERAYTSPIWYTPTPPEPHEAPPVVPILEPTAGDEGGDQDQQSDAIREP